LPYTDFTSECSRNKGRITVESILALEQSLKTSRLEVTRLQDALLDGCADAILVEMELQEAERKVKEIEKRIQSKR